MKADKFAVSDIARRAAAAHAEPINSERTAIGRLVRLDIIHPDPSQPRLKTSHEDDEAFFEIVKQYGVLQPIVVDPNKDYQIIFGERRYRAALAAGMKEIPVIFRDEASDETVLEMQIIENVHRRSMGLIAEALAALRLLEMRLGLSHRDAKALIYEVRRNQAHPARAEVERALALLGVSLNSFATFHLVALNLPDDLLELVRDMRLDPSLALAVNRLPAERREEGLRGALDGTLSQRDLDLMRVPKAPREVTPLERRFTAIAVGARFKEGRRGSSSLTLEFADRAQLEGFLKLVKIPREALEETHIPLQRGND